MPVAAPDDTGQTYWDGFYSGLALPDGWRPAPNPLLVEEMRAEPPGSAQFLHSPVERAGERDRVLRRAMSPVASGGTLLIAGHAGHPSWMDEPPFGVHLLSTVDVLAALTRAGARLVARGDERGPRRWVPAIQLGCYRLVSQ